MSTVLSEAEVQQALRELTGLEEKWQRNRSFVSVRQLCRKAMEFVNQIAEAGGSGESSSGHSDQPPNKVTLSLVSHDLGGVHQPRYQDGRAYQRPGARLNKPTARL